ncbi:MAG TPA: riboflavin synthase, partial [Dongiaceae bacterium]|nr:riboflavin synthase [Dongiaceae bacterium]
AVGRVISLERTGAAAILVVEPPAAIERYLVAKGSIAVDGISLTVAARRDGTFEVALIPETLAVTGLGTRGAGDRVNLEVDLIGRYVAEALGRRLAPPESRVTRELLERHGFVAREVAS